MFQKKIVPLHANRKCMNTTIDIFSQSPDDYARKIAQQVKKRRLEMRLTQAGLAKRADIPLATYRHFERMGKISLQGLLQIAFALNCLDDFNQLFARQQWNTLNEMLQQQQTSYKRGKKST